jgi:uncharacterized membrane protein
MAATAPNPSERLNSVDLLRGLVMVIMLLDHTREYLHADALRFSPTDLSKTSVLLFFTRWITHFCAPTFVFLAGTSVYLQLMRGKSRAELSRFLLTRGLWLIVLEFTVVRLALLFNFDYRFLGLAEVIWAIGVSMLVLAGLIYLPLRAVTVVGVAMIALHNALDAVQVPPAVSMAITPAPSAGQIIWLILHQPGFVPLFGGVTKLFVAYPLIPWVGVMAAGYALGAVYGWESGRRRKWLLRVGTLLTALFVVLRAVNIYGDPQPWSPQPSFAFSVLSFLNVTKYPVSLSFLLMTLGPALLVLAWSEGEKKETTWGRILITFGRVPLFYFLLQMFLAHALGVLISLAAGKSVGYLFLNFPQSTTEAPPGAGFSLWVVYVAWAGGLVVLYPICRWYGEIKRRHKSRLLSYL